MLRRIPLFLNKYSYIFIILIFIFIFGLISLVNQYQFRTDALDLGMLNHALYNFAHFDQNLFTLDIAGQEVNYFGDHFSPIMFLYIPFYYLFGSYALLLIQILAIAFGGYGIYKYSQLYFKNNSIPILFLIHFFGFWGIYSALSYDFHNNVVAAMFVPWLLYYYEKSNKKMFLLFFVLILISKENMALWLAFILLGLVCKKTTKSTFKKVLRFEIPLIVFALLFFVLTIRVVMPYLRDGQGFSQLARYSHLGNTIPEILNTIIQKPSYVFSLLFENTTDSLNNYGIKSQLHFMVLISGGFALFYKPRFLLMLAPIYAQKLLTNNTGFWGVHLQYSIEFIPIISISLIHFFSQVNLSKIYLYILAVATMFLTYFYTYDVIEERGIHAAFYSKAHYQSSLNLKEINIQLEKIPSDAIVSVSSSIAPHLAARNTIYSLPHIKDAEYIILFTDKRSAYPISREQQKKDIEKLITSKRFTLVYSKNNLLVLKRNSNY